jgi:hypothetical protein
MSGKKAYRKRKGLPELTKIITQVRLEPVIEEVDEADNIDIVYSCHHFKTGVEAGFRTNKKYCGDCGVLHSIHEETNTIYVDPIYDVVCNDCKDFVTACGKQHMECADRLYVDDSMQESYEGSPRPPKIWDAFIAACRSGDMAVIDWCIEKQPYYMSSHTGMETACESGHMDIAGRIQSDKPYECEGGCGGVRYH